MSFDQSTPEPELRDAECTWSTLRLSKQFAFVASATCNKAV